MNTIMNDEQVILTDGRAGTLTVEHSASSYGLPVLLVGERVLGAAEYPHEFECGGELVNRWNEDVRRFCVFFRASSAGRKPRSGNG
jgi:hypothetical protein